MTRTSTVNLTLTIETPGGVPGALTAAAIAAAAANGAQAAIASKGGPGAWVEVTGTVSSAFIVRTETSEEVPA